MDREKLAKQVGLAHQEYMKQIGRIVQRDIRVISGIGWNHYVQYLIENPKITKTLMKNYGLPVHAFNIDYKHVNFNELIKHEDSRSILQFPKHWIETDKGLFLDSIKRDFNKLISQKEGELFEKLEHCLNMYPLQIEMEDILASKKQGKNNLERKIFLPHHGREIEINFNSKKISYTQF